MSAPQPPDQKNGLLELLNNLWLPAAGFIGAVTLAYNFYQSWLGDQATVTYFLGGGGLLVLLIALAWVGFKTKTTETATIYYLADEKIPATKKTKRAAYPYYKAARIGLALVFVGVMAGGAVLYQRRQALKDKLVVLIATFEGPEEVYGLRNEIIEKLSADFPNDDQVEIVKVSDVITPDQGSPAARALGERYLADVVLWGWYRPTQNPNITIHIENLDQDQSLPLKTSDTLQPAVTLAELESFSFQQQAGQETSALVSFLAGFIQYQSNNYAQALVRFDDALAKIPGDAVLLKNQAEIYFYRGATRLYLGENDQAIADYSKAIQLNPQDAETYNNRGFAYDKQGKYERGIKDYDIAIAINPRYAMAYNNRGYAYSALGDSKRAIQDFTQAIAIDSNFALAYNNRGGTFDSLGQYERGIQDYDKAIAINPRYAMAYNNRGFAYKALKQYRLAIQDYDKALSINPQLVTVYYCRGLAYTGLKQYDQAIADYSKTIQINPQDADAYSTRGLAYAIQKQYGQAIADFSKAIQINPQFSGAYYNRGLVYQVLGKTAEAAADFAKSKELGGQ